jgi:hypothetical protein
MISISDIVSSLVQADASEAGAIAFAETCQNVPTGKINRHAIYTEWARCFRHNHPNCNKASKLIWPDIVLKWLRVCTGDKDDEDEETSRRLGTERHCHSTDLFVVSLKDFVYYIIPK